VAVAWEVWRHVREFPRSVRVGLSVLGVIVIVSATVKQIGSLFDDDPSDPPGNGQVNNGGGNMQNNGGGSGMQSSPLPLPQWFVDLNLPADGWDGIANIPLIWRQRTLTDSPDADNLLDRDGDGLSDFAEFILGSDPRSASTSGGIIDDLWLWARNLDPLLVWDDEIAPCGRTYLEVYLHGLEPDDDSDYFDWIERGLIPGVDQWPEGEDEEGDVTLVLVGVTGDAEGSTFLTMGPVRHVGEPKIYGIAQK